MCVCVCVCVKTLSFRDRLLRSRSPELIELIDFLAGCAASFTSLLSCLNWNGWLGVNIS